MDQLRWTSRPPLRNPAIVVAFEGWNDAGDAATLALGYLASAWDAEPFASIDPEDFYDFTETRPQVKVGDDGERAIEWPEVELLSATIPGTDRDVILVRGTEPQLRWRTFCAAIVEVADAYSSSVAVILGALLADVPHTRPVRVSGNADDEGLATRLGLLATNYEGPTGIVGVLHQELRDAGIPTASFWAAVPHYVHQVPSPKAALALLERSATVLDTRLNPLELRVAAEEYERQVSDRVADDDEAAAYVAQLEEADDSDPGEIVGIPADGSELAAEVEQYLRQHPEP